MKNYTSIAWLLAVVAFTVSTVSCSNPKSKKGYEASITGSESVEVLPQQEMEFIYEIYNLNKFNSWVAREAQIRSTSLEASLLADSVTVASALLNEKIEAILAKHNLSTPGDIDQEQKQQWKELVKQKGWNFDRQFLLVMEKNLKAIHNYCNTAVETLADVEVKTIASEALNMLQSQGQLALALQDKIEERTADDPLQDENEVAAQFISKKGN